MGYSRREAEIEALYKSLGLEKEEVWHRTKELLKIYRKVVWSIHTRINNMLCEEVATYGKSLDKALGYLYDFAPLEKKKDFEDNVINLFETRWLIGLIDKSLDRIRTYPEQGEIYFNIIHNVYLKENKLLDTECMGIVSMEKSMYYQRKKEAISLMGIALWGYAIPEIRNEIELLESHHKIELTPKNGQRTNF